MLATALLVDAAPATRESLLPPISPFESTADAQHPAYSYLLPLRKRCSEDDPKDRPCITCMPGKKDDILCLFWGPHNLEIVSRRQLEEAPGATTMMLEQLERSVDKKNVRSPKRPLASCAPRLTCARGSWQVAMWYGWRRDKEWPALADGAEEAPLPLAAVQSSDPVMTVTRLKLKTEEKMRIRLFKFKILFCEKARKPLSLLYLDNFDDPASRKAFAAHTKGSAFLDLEALKRAPPTRGPSDDALALAALRDKWPDTVQNAPDMLTALCAANAKHIKDGAYQSNDNSCGAVAKALNGLLLGNPQQAQRLIRYMTHYGVCSEEEVPPSGGGGGGGRGGAASDVADREPGGDEDGAQEAMVSQVMSRAMGGARAGIGLGRGVAGASPEGQHRLTTEGLWHLIALIDAVAEQPEAEKETVAYVVTFAVCETNDFIRNHILTIVQTGGVASLLMGYIRVYTLEEYLRDEKWGGKRRWMRPVHDPEHGIIAYLRRLGVGLTSDDPVVRAEAWDDAFTGGQQEHAKAGTTYMGSHVNWAAFAYKYSVAGRTGEPVDALSEEGRLQVHVRVSDLP